MLKIFPPAMIAGFLLAGVCLCSAQIVLNGDFETPPQPGSSAVYHPPAFGWSFTPSAGIISYPGYYGLASFSAPKPPSGDQLAFLQQIGAGISQVITLPVDGTYSISYQDASRPSDYDGAVGGSTTYQVLIDSNVIAQVSTYTGQLFTPESFTFISTAGPHKLMFKIVSVYSDTIDDTAFFDVVNIVAIPPDLTINQNASLPSLKIFGQLTTTNLLEYKDDLSTTNGWVALTNIVFTTSPVTFLDYSATNSMRFYRCVPIP